MKQNGLPLNLSCLKRENHKIIITTEPEDRKIIFKKREKYTPLDLWKDLKNDSVVSEICPSCMYMLHLLLIFPIGIACVERLFREWSSSKRDSETRWNKLHSIHCYVSQLKCRQLGSVTKFTSSLLMSLKNQIRRWNYNCKLLVVLLSNIVTLHYYILPSQYLLALLFFLFFTGQIKNMWHLLNNSIIFVAFEKRIHIVKESHCFIVLFLLLLLQDIFFFTKHFNREENHCITHFYLFIYLFILCR